MKEWTANHSAIAGAGAGLVTSIAGCPLDVVKTKLQAQQFAVGSVAYKGVAGAFILLIAWPTNRSYNPAVV